MKKNEAPKHPVDEKTGKRGGCHLVGAGRPGADGVACRIGVIEKHPWICIVRNKYFDVAWRSAEQGAITFSTFAGKLVEDL
ncbi:hypothetical protein ACO0LO_24405 [Undibacterium sp. TJN25]|uniref:hypothetical protein n=1 Tax=Undibacterium sp. TJN25 TaxID=3413056 RepID=UPI003BF13E2A